MKNQNMKFILLSVISSVLLSVFSSGSNVHAVYNGAKILDNGFFLNSSTMTIQDIQTFLANKGSGLASRSFFFNCYEEDSKEREWYSAVGAPCNRTVPAADIIYFTSQIYGINPQVTLATLQKEQSLVTSPNPTDWQISQAMGYGCPTTGSCDSASNFFYQVDSGVWLLRYHYERARGNMSWWYQSTSWVCGSEKNFYKPSLYPYQDVGFFDEDGVKYRTYYLENAATSSFYCYTPHAYNNPQGLYGREPFGTIGRYYSGSYNFVYYFELWFGITSGPAAFTTPNSSTIYMQVSGYKMVVPHTAIMQDFGVSVDAIEPVTQSYADSLPAPGVETGISSSISHVVKTPSDTDSDGGSIYLISLAKRYTFQSMQQFFDYGFTENQISYLPMDYVLSRTNAGTLPNFITSPHSSVFKIDGNKKRIIFDYVTYIAQNPTDKVAALSYYLADRVPSGNPIANKPILVKRATSEAVYLYDTNKYFWVTDLETFRCWGFDGSLGVPVYRVKQNNYLPSFTSNSNVSSCIVRINESDQVLRSNKRFVLGNEYGLVGNSVDTTLENLLSTIPLNPTPLKSYIKSTTSAAVWAIENGSRRMIPSYRNFNLLGLKDTDVDIVGQSVINAVPKGEIKLANGLLVKGSSSAAIYAIADNRRILYPSNDLFLAYGNSWSDIETYDSVDLNQAYPYQNDEFNNYLVNNSTSSAYLVTATGCYKMSEEELQNFGTTFANLLALQPYGIDSVRSMSFNCANATRFIKHKDSSLVYWVDEGTKYPLTTYVSMLSKNGGVIPQVMVVTTTFLDNIPNGTSN
ncbi:hypothetical protein EOL73_02605 [Candidatus Saccharibacteria bacterium]|nr:hypothetical protein [Candidatus Saccharibacteria bacterium]